MPYADNCSPGRAEPYPPSEISPHIHSAGSVAVLVNVETTPVQLHAILFPSGDPARRGISSYLRARWVFMTFCESHASQVPFHAVWHMPAAGWSANRDIAAARRSWERARTIADALPAGLLSD